MKKEEESHFSRRTFAAGLIAVVFMAMGYQVALFVHQASVVRIAANRDEPDTVYVYKESCGGTVVSEKPVRADAVHSGIAMQVRSNIPVRKVESFRFDPNTVSIDDLCRLGFSRKQAMAIDSYRAKGGRFRRKSDFARSYVVSDSIYRRLESYIDIPLLDLNLADSAALDALPGIGGWFAGKILEHRAALGGFSYKEQLMDVWRLDKEKYDGLQDLVTVSARNVRPYPLWTLPADSLCRHPYIGSIETARAIVLYRESSPKGQWTIDGLVAAGIITVDTGARLGRCVLVSP